MHVSQIGPRVSRFVTVALAALITAAAAGPAAATSYVYRQPSAGLTAVAAGTPSKAPADTASCALPWGGTLASGQSVSAYAAATVADPSTCASVEVIETCTAGVLSYPSAVQSCAVADANFSKVSLLTHFEGAAADVAGHAATVGSAASISSANYKVGAQSAYFDGTANSYFEYPNAPEFNITSSDLTLEAWIYPTYVAAKTQNTVVGGSNWSLWVTNGRALSWVTENKAIVSSATNVIPLNTWSHVAVVRSGTTITLYLNGSSVASATVANGTFGTAPLRIGDYGTYPGRNFTGYIDEVRLSKGIARYSGSFTPSLTAFPDR